MTFMTGDLFERVKQFGRGDGTNGSSVCEDAARLKSSRKSKSEIASAKPVSAGSAAASFGAACFASARKPSRINNPQTISAAAKMALASRMMYGRVLKADNL